VRTLAAALCCFALTSVEVTAQTLPGGRTAIEAVAAVASTSDLPDDPFVWLDLAATFRVSSTFDIVVRPYARRLPGGDWDTVIYQAQIRYQPAGALRIDAGIITSPLGLGSMELRPDLNPVVSYPFYYFGSLPPFDQFSNRVQVLSGGYPLGAMASWSGARWDARAAITDGTPARTRYISQEGPAATPQFIAGGGFTPITGLRFGAGIATGKYRKTTDGDYFGATASTGPIPDANARLFNLEGEYSFRYTRISGEWIRDRFDTTTSAAIARGYYVQAVQTLTPRLFAAGRWTGASTPVRTATGRIRRTRAVAEVTGGYRLTPELTIKAGYQTSRAFGVSDWNHTAIWSLVWSQRWF
jgi:hypothetical protein